MEAHVPENQCPATKEATATRSLSMAMDSNPHSLQLEKAHVHPRIEPGSPVLQEDSLSTELSETQKSAQFINVVMIPCV